MSKVYFSSGSMNNSNDWTASEGVESLLTAALSIPALVLTVSATSKLSPAVFTGRKPL
jgi:hypothetical protein